MRDARPTKMTKTEFIEARKRLQRSSMHRMIGVSIAFVCIVASLLILPGLVPPSYENTVTTLLMVALAANSAIYIAGVFGDPRRRDLHCPECRGALIGHAGDTAVQTNRCPHCGLSPFEL